MIERISRAVPEDGLLEKTIEATGRSGNDAGFDIRAYERVDRVSRSESEEGDEIEELHPLGLQLH